MILNENYFDELKLTDEDIESSDGIAISNNNEYTTPEEWFADIKSKYAHCINIPLKRNISWKLNPKPIIKRLLYVFDTYGIEYSEPTLQELIYIEQNLQNDYSKCNFIDYNGYKIISNHYKTQEIVDMAKNTISLVVFFNLPEVHSYKSACTFIGNIINCLTNNKIKDLIYNYFNVWVFEPVLYKRIFTLNRNIIETREVEITIKMFFPEKSTTAIKQELFANGYALLSKLLRCFGQYYSN